jgi:hypothetical protein
MILFDFDVLNAAIIDVSLKLLSNEGNIDKK